MEDTFEGDYGRWLERIAKVGKGDKVLASPSVPSWNQIVQFLESMRKLQELAGSAA